MKQHSELGFRVRAEGRCWLSSMLRGKQKAESHPQLVARSLWESEYDSKLETAPLG